MLEPAIKDKRHWWNRGDIILLVLLGVLFLAPGLGQIPLFDRDEPRFATAARNMGVTGDFIVPRFNGALRPDKPPMIYWLMNVAYAALGGAANATELGARLPSAICGTLTLLVVYFMTGSRFGRWTGLLAAGMLGTCVLFLVESRMATADSAMLLSIVTCMACAWQAWEAGGIGTGGGRLPRADYLLDRSGEGAGMMIDHLPVQSQRRMSLETAMLFWVALAVGTLVKGVPLIFVFVPMICLSVATGALPGQLRQWRSHFHLTKMRVGGALFIAALVTAIVAVASAYPDTEVRGWAVFVGIVLIGMLLTPGLPGILLRCWWKGNWAWWRQLRPLIGAPILIVLVGWWVVWAGMATDWRLIKDMVENHLLNRSMGWVFELFHIHITDVTGPGGADAMKTYSRPPGFYLLLVWATFWPWSILLVPAGFHVVRRMRGKTAIAIDARPYQFLVAWIIPMWVVLEASRGKLPHYPLPLYVALAILCADTLIQSWQRLTDVLAAEWFSVMRWVTTLIWIGLGVGVLVLAHMHEDRDIFWRCYWFAMALMATGFANAATWGKKSWPAQLATGWFISLLLLNILILPALPELQVSKLAGLRMRQLAGEDPGLHLAARGYEEPSLVFYSGRNVDMYSDTETLLKNVPFAPSANPAGNRYLVVVNDAAKSELDHRGVIYYPVRRIDFPMNLKLTDSHRIAGFNTANFKPVAITVIANTPPVPATSRSAGEPVSPSDPIRPEASSATQKSSGTPR